MDIITEIHIRRTQPGDKGGTAGMGSCFSSQSVSERCYEYGKEGMGDGTDGRTE